MLQIKKLTVKLKILKHYLKLFQMGLKIIYNSKLFFPYKSFIIIIRYQQILDSNDKKIDEYEVKKN